jgi:hypothetical protein
MPRVRVPYIAGVPRGVGIPRRAVKNDLVSLAVLLVRNSRKTECDAKQFLIWLAARRTLCAARRNQRHNAACPPGLLFLLPE